MTLGQVGQREVRFGFSRVGGGGLTQPIKHLIQNQRHTPQVIKDFLGGSQDIPLFISFRRFLIVLGNVCIVFRICERVIFTVSQCSYKRTVKQNEFPELFSHRFSDEELC